MWRWNRVKIKSVSDCQWKNLKMSTTKRFFFDVNCNDFTVGSEGRLKFFARSIIPHSIVKMVGMVCCDGNPEFNSNRSCSHTLIMASLFRWSLCSLSNTTQTLYILHDISKPSQHPFFRFLVLYLQKSLMILEWRLQTHEPMNTNTDCMNHHSPSFQLEK
jgi:hypothetical protein